MSTAVTLSTFQLTRCRLACNCDDLAGHHGLPPREAIEQAVEWVDYRAVRIDGRTATLERPGTKITLEVIRTTGFAVA